MTARGYTTVELVVNEMGVELTAPQLDQIADMIADAESWIDVQTGRAWIVTSPTTGELHTIDQSRLVYLNNRPVTAVSSVVARGTYVGATNRTLVANTDYELIDAAHGILMVNDPASGYDIITDRVWSDTLLTVAYTSSTPVPADIQRAATLLVSAWMLARTLTDYRGLKSYSVGSELSVTLADGSQGAVPGDVMQIIRAREAMIFA